MSRSACVSLLLPVLLMVAGCNEQPYRNYSGAPEAIAAGERDRGWYPEWLPASAADVHIQGNLDTNAFWIRADLSRVAADSLRMLLRPVGPGQVRVHRPRSSSSWWFESLIVQAPENDGGLRADLFRGAGDVVPSNVTVAFQHGSRTVYVWTGGIR